MSGPGRKALLVTTGLVLATVAVSTAATQFVAHRLGYHPSLGGPWFSHVYAPWSWVSWMQAPWAVNAKATFAYLTSGMMVTVAGALLLGLAASNSRRRKPRKHADVHGSARLMTAEAELCRTGLLPRKGKPHAGVYVGGWTDPRGRIHYLRHDGP